MIVEQQQGVPRHFGPLRNLIHHNSLRAIDLATGKDVWQTGGRAGAVPAELADAYFLGPPLPVGGSLLALAEKQSDLRLVCLSPDKGTLLWTQTLATSRTRLLLDVPRRTHAVHLAYRDGVLVCPTNAGAILGIDLLSRTLLWAHSYRERAPATPPPGMEMPASEIPPDMFGDGLKYTAPILAGDRVVYGPPDGESIRCLNLRDGSLVWKSPRTEDDLYVGGVQDGRVLIVGRSSCRALSLAKGETLWHQATPEPAGLGTFCGKQFYLPLRDNGVLVLDPDRPNPPTRLDCRKDEAKGNLVFHAGDLWSQDDAGVTAYPQLATKLAQVEAVLKRSPDDLPTRLEHARLLLDRGDPSGAVVDLKSVLAASKQAELTAQSKTLLYTALTRLLQRDFAAGEKHLDEYRTLCKVEVPPDADAVRRMQLRAEERRRQAGYFAVLAHGREGQGRLTDALHAYRDLYDATLGGDLLALPDDPAAQVRPDLWVRSHVAETLARATPEQLAAARAEIEREAKALPPGDLAARTRFAALFGAASGPECAAGREVRLRLAVRLADGDDRRHVLAGLLDLHALTREPGARDITARALEARARALAARGLVEDAAACYRELARDHADVSLSPGRTGAAALAELAADKRFAPSLDTVRPAWEGRVLNPTETKERSPSPGLVLPDGFNSVGPTGQTEGGRFVRATELSASVRDVRFVLDLPAARLRVVRRLPEVELWSVPLPLGGPGNLGVPLKMIPTACGYWPVGHLVVVTAGPLLFGLDLAERRVCWARNVGAGVPGPLGLSVGPDGGVVATRPDGQPFFLGLIASPDLNGVYVQTAAGLEALDPATGAVRWQRTDVAPYFTTFRDGTHLFLAESHRPGAMLRGVRAVRTADGVLVPVPAQESAVAHYPRKLRTVGGCLLVAQEGDTTPLELFLYDVLAGKEVWHRQFPAKSVVAESVDPDLVAVLAPGGDAWVIDLSARRELAKLRLDPKYLHGLRSATLLNDRANFYVALRGEQKPDADEAPVSLFQGELGSVVVNGELYAFGRETGKVRWHLRMYGQTILLDRFDELPLVLCASRFRKPVPSSPDANVSFAQQIRSIDKVTGKTRLNLEGALTSDPFHTLRVDPLRGTIDMISDELRVRHQPE
jgi:outer membrane protein assembly factor BamB